MLMKGDSAATTGGTCANSLQFSFHKHCRANQLKQGGGLLIWLGGHFEKAAISGGPYLWKCKQASIQVYISTNIYCDRLEEISDFT